MTRHASAIYRAMRRSAGIGLVTAIFLLVVLAGLGVAMVAISTTQQTSAALDELGARAYQAARAGVEWGVFRQLRTPVAPCAAYTGPGSGTKTSITFPAETSLSAFTVTVVCATLPGPTSEPALDRRLIQATACNQPTSGACPATTNNPDYVQRVVEVQI